VRGNRRACHKTRSKSCPLMPTDLRNAPLGHFYLVVEYCGRNFRDVKKATRKRTAGQRERARSAYVRPCTGGGAIGKSGDSVKDRSLTHVYLHVQLCFVAGLPAPPSSFAREGKSSVFFFFLSTRFKIQELEDRGDCPQETSRNFCFF
jgi:hypothetical protein